MKLSMAARVLTGLTAVAMLIAFGSTNSYAYHHRAKAKWVVAKAPVYVAEPNIKLRYYGGPKSPMYP